MNTYTITINGTIRGRNLTVNQMIGMLAPHESGGVLRTEQYGAVNAVVLVEAMTAGIIGSTGRTANIYNATIIGLGADFGTVTIS